MGRVYEIVMTLKCTVLVFSSIYAKHANCIDLLSALGIMLINMQESNRGVRGKD